MGGHDLLLRLRASGIPFARVNSIPDVFDDEQVKHLGSFFEIEHEAGGKVHGVRCPVMYEKERNEDIKPPPLLGEHTREVLAEIGCDASQIEDILGMG
jgi:crotonobetainyl-CoA:carnitine CoA-transferase CaiB-like acyl-CoA transferase